MATSPLERMTRSIAFARHIPLHKLTRRAELSLRRAVRDRLPQRPRTSATPPRLAARPPQPLFSPRTGALRRDGDTLTVSFLERRQILSLPDIDWMIAGEGSAHQLWRMNLHYMEYLEEAAPGLWQILVGAWIAGNPPGRRGAWRDGWNSYALSLRVVVWMQELARRGAEFSADTRAAAAASLAEQLVFLEQNLETDLGGNHLVKNIKALIWAGAFFEGGAARHWRDLGVRLLDCELDRQILGDGMHYERSPSYHCQVFADLLEIRHALGAEISARLDAVLSRMAQVTADLAHPDGGIAEFNDAGLSMAYAPAECLAVYATLAGGAVRPRSVFALKHAGYFGARVGDTYFVADFGRIAPDDLPAHGHGDIGSFELSAAGQRIIVDQGVFEYVAGPRRQASRASASHNTLAFDGADQADFFGAFRCGRRPDVTVLEFAPRGDGFMIEAAHDGYATLTGRPRAVRRFDVAADRIVVSDRIDATTERAASIGFLLHPAVEVSVSGSEARLSRGDALVTVTADRAIEVEQAVWWPDMGCEQPARRLRIRLGRGPCRSVVALRLDAAGGTRQSRETM